MLKTLCMSVTGVYMARKTSIQKDQPSRSSKRLANVPWQQNMPKDDNWSNKWEGVRHLEETHGMTFSACNHACHWRHNDMTMINGLSSYTKRCILKDGLCFPYLPSKGLCMRWSFHVVPIFYHTLGSLVSLYFILNSLRFIYHVIHLHGH